MGSCEKQILILRKDPAFIEKLELYCHSIAFVSSVQSLEDLLEAISLKKFDLLLLQWDFFSLDNSFDFNTIEQLQPETAKIALFQNPELSALVSAMKIGCIDAIWPYIEPNEMLIKIQDALSGKRRIEIPHTHLSPIVESLARQSFEQKATLFQARKAFFHQFIGMILDNSNLSRYQLASLLEVSPRTLQRYISLSKNSLLVSRPKNP